MFLATQIVVIVIDHSLHAHRANDFRRALSRLATNAAVFRALAARTIIRRPFIAVEMITFVARTTAQRVNANAARKHLHGRGKAK